MSYHDDENSSRLVLRNKRILLIRRPNGLPVEEDFRLDEEILEISKHPAKPSIFLETLYVSIDPAMRGWMSTAKSYLPPVKLGTVMRASTISKVIAIFGDDQHHALQSLYPVGSIVRSEVVGVQSYYVLPNCSTQKAKKLLKKLDTNPQQFPPPNTHLSYASYLGVLGTTGLTAYFGFLRVGKPKPPDTVLVSGAAGATGSIVAQIAKYVVGCRVIGTSGTDAKCEWLVRNKIVDAAINYKTSKSLSKAIQKLAPNGVNVVFDNVGSDFLEASLSNLAHGARVVLCGAISQYNHSSKTAKMITGPRNYMNLLVKRATMQGFVVFDYQKEYSTAISNLIQWISEGKIRCYQEDLRGSGIEQFYPSLLSLFQGTNTGKVVVKIKEDCDSPTTTATVRSRL